MDFSNLLCASWPQDLITFSLPELLFCFSAIPKCSAVLPAPGVFVFSSYYPTCSGICRIECFYSTEKGRHGFPSDSIAAFVSYFTGIENVFNILLLKMASAFQSAAQSYLRRSQPATA